MLGGAGGETGRGGGQKQAEAGVAKEARRRDREKTPGAISR